MRHRLGRRHHFEGLDYGEARRFGPVRVSLHSAGHVLGSAQVRLAHDDGRVWVVTGDFKRDPDPTCAPFEVVPGDTLITESTYAFGKAQRVLAALAERPEHAGRTVYLHGAMVALTGLYRRAGVPMLASGWMRIRGNRRRRGYDHSFELSDHADWPALLSTVRESGARTVLTTHGRSDELVRYLNEEEGIEARALSTLYGGEDD